MIKDLTVGKPEEVLWKFPIPMFISVIFQQMYNIVDSVIAGKFAGEDALTAVGASYPIIMIFMAIAMGSNIGCSVVISQTFSGKQHREMETVVYTALIFSVVLSLVLTVAELLGTDWLIRMTQTPGNIFNDGALYLGIHTGGFLLPSSCNICTGILQSLGDSKMPLYFLICPSVGNVILDWIFVVEFGWGMIGVAWAVSLAQGVPCVLAFLTLMVRLRGIETDGPVPRFEWEMLGHVSRIAVPSILQQSFISIGNIFIQGLINGHGSSVIAEYLAAVRLNTSMITSFITLVNGLSSFTAQNIGAGQVERVRKGLKAGARMALGVAPPFFLLLFFLGNTMTSMFMKEGGMTAMDIGAAFLKVVSPFYFMISSKLMADGALRRAGDMVYLMITTFTDLILRMILAYMLASFIGTLGIWISWPVGWVVITALSTGFYLLGKWNPLKE